MLSSKKPKPAKPTQGSDCKYQCLYVDMNYESGALVEEDPEEHETESEHDALYCFSISLQKHVDDVLSKLDTAADKIHLVFSRNTNERNAPYDLSGLRQFANLRFLVISPEDCWEDPIKVKIPCDVIARIKRLDSDWISLTVMEQTRSETFVALDKT